jgi:hypothetical protein
MLSSSIKGQSHNLQLTTDNQISRAIVILESSNMYLLKSLYALT